MKRLSGIILLLMAAASVSYGQQDTSIYVKVGQKVPAFKCTSITGQTVDTKDLNGKVLLINFFATWCPPCNKELPVLQSNIMDKYAGNKNFVLVVAGREETVEKLKEFAKEKNFRLPFVPDPERGIYGLFFGQTIPRNVVVGKDGKISYISTGYSEEEFKKLEDHIAGLLK